MKNVTERNTVEENKEKTNENGRMIMRGSKDVYSSSGSLAKWHDNAVPDTVKERERCQWTA